MRIPSTAPPEIQQSFREVWSGLDVWAGGLNIDMHGRRLMNAGAAVADTDYATLADVRHQITGPLAAISRAAGQGVAALSGTNAVRVATAPSPVGVLFVTTDRGNALYQAQLVTGAPAWVWVGGGPLSGVIANITTGLGTTDTGYLYHASDFDRVFQWTGSAWQDAPAAPPRHLIAYFAAVPAPPTGWQACDGSTVTRSTSTGSTTNVTVPNLTTAGRFIKSVVVGSVGGTGGSATTHTHAVDPPSTTSGNNSASQEVQSGTGVTVAEDPHTHDTNIASFTSGAPSGVGGDDALPPWYGLAPYYRL